MTTDFIRQWVTVPGYRAPTELLGTQGIGESTTGMPLLSSGQLCSLSQVSKQTSGPLTRAEWPATLQVLLIPGNPGVASFYTPFMRYLQTSLLPQRADMFACSYLGHTRHAAAKAEVPTP
jgi:hypothetical protein